MQGKKLFHLSDWLNKRSLIKGKMWKRRRSGGKWDGEKERITRMELRRKGGRRGVTQSSKTKAAALTISILLSRRVSPPRSISSPGKALANVRDTRVPGWPIRIQSVHGRTIHGGCTGWFEKLEKPYFFSFERFGWIIDRYRFWRKKFIEGFGNFAEIYDLIRVFSFLLFLEVSSGLIVLRMQKLREGFEDSYSSSKRTSFFRCSWIIKCWDKHYEDLGRTLRKFYHSFWKMNLGYSNLWRDFLKIKNISGNNGIVVVFETVGSCYNKDK